MNIDIIAAAPILLWALNIVVVIGGGIVGTLLSFWLRNKVVIADRIQKFKWRGDWDGQSADWVLMALVEVIGGFAIAVLLTKLIVEGIALPIILAIGVILALVYVPRWVIDICKGLKMNHKSGDLEKLSQLEKQIAELKQKVEK